MNAALVWNVPPIQQQYKINTLRIQSVFSQINVELPGVSRKAQVWMYPSLAA